jgi:hypothetical protein
MGDEVTAQRVRTEIKSLTAKDAKPAKERNRTALPLRTLIRKGKEQPHR